MALLDDLTEIRVAAIDSYGDWLANPAGIWADNDAAVLVVSGSPTTESIRVLRETWSGGDSAQLATTRTIMATGRGGRKQGEVAMPLSMSIPISEHLGDSNDPKHIEVLTREVFRTGDFMVGFRRETLGESRYAVQCTYDGGLDKSTRGEGHRRKSSLNFTSDWPWKMEYNTVASGRVFTPDVNGAADVVWGVLFPAITTAATITFNARPAVTFGDAGNNFAAGEIYCPSPPFQRRPGNLVGDAILPAYLSPGVAYTITTQPAGTIFYYTNRAKI